MSEIMETAITILRDAVEKAGSFREAAAQLGVSHAALFNWINGKRGVQLDVFLSTLEKLGATLVPNGRELKSESIQKNAEEAVVDQYQRRIDVLTGQVEILQKIIYGMNAKKENSQPGVNKEIG